MKRFALTNLVLVLMLTGCLANPCANSVVDEVRSPGGKYDAIVFQRDCGASTGFSTQVSIVPAGKKLRNEKGNVFVATTNHGRAPSGPGGGPLIEVRWAGDDRLIIIHDARAELFHKEERYREVLVTYQLRN